jgi:hypothetical protein
MVKRPALEPPREPTSNEKGKKKPFRSVLGRRRWLVHEQHTPIRCLPLKSGIAGNWFGLPAPINQQALGGHTSG